MANSDFGLYELAVNGSTFGKIGALLGGLIIVGALIWSFWIGDVVRSREPRAPTAEEQPHLPEGGAVREVREMREPDEVPHAKNESERLMPYNLHSSGDRRSDNQDSPRWGRGLGSYGSGEPETPHGEQQPNPPESPREVPHDKPQANA
ncbi:DUF6479 family protein [Streptomyces boluensis]|uniref:DUF6479 family protein n=1 Tax=Streptomyces boluensis TaxID=1775135 RepID=UPI001CB714C2|nr:DUF6479 family protein [Streptomyces boluensis]